MYTTKKTNLLLDPHFKQKNMDLHFLDRETVIHCYQSFWDDCMISPGAKLENGDLPYTESPLSFDGFN